MGEVWLAYDEDLDGRPVAIKKMHQHMLADAEDVARFQREMRIASRMQHPNIMTMFTTGSDNGVPFMVMEYLSATGTLIGTLPYMAPEQWLGGPAAFSNDIWAVGCVLYELLSGRPARSYATATEYVAAAARRERVAPLPGGVPAWLADAVTMMLQPDPAQRPTSAQCVQLLAGPVAYLPPAWSPTQVPQSNTPRQSPPQQPVPAGQPASSASARQAPVGPATASSTFGVFPGGPRQPLVGTAQRPVTFSPPTTTVGRSRRRFLIAAGGTGLAAIGATTAWKLLGSGPQQLPGSGSGLPVSAIRREEAPFSSHVL